MPSTNIDLSLEQRLQETGALLEGHFQLSSGLHSNRYVQCARMLQYPEHASGACRELASRISQPVDVVVGPALGGVIVSYEIARFLGVRALFTERHDGRMKLRRGFAMIPGERVLVVEDVVTTGLSAREAAEAVRAQGGEVIAFASLVDRSAGKADFGLPFYALMALEFTAHEPEQCPGCAAGLPIVKPGSRNANAST